MSSPSLPELFPASAVVDLAARLARLERAFAAAHPDPAPPPADAHADTVEAHERTPGDVPWPPPRTAPADPRATDVLAAVPEPVLAVDPDGRVELWTPAAAEAFGWSAGDVLGRPPGFLAADAATAFQRLLAQARAGVRVRGAYLPVRAADGRTVSAHASAGPDAGGSVVVVLRPTTVEDVPLAVPVADADPPSRPLETVGRIAAGLAHDVANLMTVVGGNGEFLAAVAPNAPAREAAEAVTTAARHAAALARRVVAVAAGRGVRSGPTDPNAVLAGLDRLLRAAAGGARLVVAPGVGVPAAAVAPVELEQILLNLVANARQALPDGGTIGVRTGAAAVRPGRVGWPADRPPGRYAVLTVADTGTGIDPRILARVFDPFVTGQPGGTGLGLAGVHELVGRVGGHVEADSAVDRGTVFRVYLPAVPAGVSRPAETVLLVDDDEAVRGLARAALERAGFAVTEAAAGDEAWRLARALPTPPGVLVADVVLPGLNGRKLAARLRAERPGLPVVFVSGYPQPPGELPPGVAFVAKPFRPRELLAAVGRVRASV
jgi:PAS domain S-box-containing protein